MEAIADMAESAQAAQMDAQSQIGMGSKHEPLQSQVERIPTPQSPLKRPIDQTEDEETTAAKRLKESQDEEPSLEDQMALLVQNALGDVSNLVNQFGGDTNGLDTAQEGDLPPEPEVALQEESPEPAVAFLAEPMKAIRMSSIPVLGNLAIQMILIFSQQPFKEMLEAIRSTESAAGEAYLALLPTFVNIIQIFSTKESAIPSADALGLTRSAHRETIRIANLAKFCVDLFSAVEQPDPVDQLLALHTHFLTIFVAELGDLTADITDLYIAFTTRVAIKAVAIRPEQFNFEELIDGFRSNLEAGFLTIRSSSPEATPQEQDLLASVQRIKENLLSEVTGISAQIGSLGGKYPMEDVLPLLNSYLHQQLDSLSSLATRYGIQLPPSEVPAAFEQTGDDEMDAEDLSSFFEKTASGLVQNALAGLTASIDAAAAEPLPTTEGSVSPADDNSGATTSSQKPNGDVNAITDYKELEALVAQSTSDYVQNTLNTLSPMPYQPTVPSATGSMISQSPYLSHLQQGQGPAPYYGYQPAEPNPQSEIPGSNESLPPSQSLPSAILYDRARQAALSKTSAHQRREGNTSTRRPWSQEEEKALMTGLDMVEGPHWSQILGLFGPNGTLSDILKDRTQVQLKDKARNLKLFFLKTNSEMPYYLQAVTGELKTRAPTQAARKEAEERARLTSEDDQARIQGIMTLADGLRNRPPTRSSETPAATAGTAPVQHATSAVATAQAAIPLQVTAPQQVTPPSVIQIKAEPSSATTQTAAPPLPPTQPRPQQTQQHTSSTPQVQPQPQSRNSLSHTSTVNWEASRPAPTASMSVHDDALDGFNDAELVRGVQELQAYGINNPS